MADLQYNEFTSDYDFAQDAQARLADRARRWVSISGAVCSVVLVLGLALWGYRLAVRDVTGIPVMRAAAGAMRTAPADPGGEQAVNQGLTVNAIAAVGTSAKPSDQIILAPQAVVLQAGDVPKTAAVPVADGQAALPASPAAQDPGLSVSGSTTASAPLDVSSDTSPIHQSIRPQPRPTALAAGASVKALPVKVQTVSSQSVKEIDPATIALGTRLAQFGTFATPQLARAKFVELQGTFGDLMLGKAMVIQSATSGGSTFYRLRAQGFQGDDDTRQFCSALKAEDADCVPVTIR